MYHQESFSTASSLIPYQIMKCPKGEGIIVIARFPLNMISAMFSFPDSSTWHHLGYWWSWIESVYRDCGMLQGIKCLIFCVLMSEKGSSWHQQQTRARVSFCGPISELEDRLISGWGSVFWKLPVGIEACRTSLGRNLNMIGFLLTVEFSVQCFLRY